VIRIKVLLIHNYYQQSGGEDKVVQQEMRLLREHGVEVSLYSVHNDIIKQMNALQKVRSFVETVWSYSQYKEILGVLNKEKPDVVHIHNFFPLISPSVYYACNKLNIPVVQTLHNYRLVCPAATFMRDGKICESCLKGSVLNSIYHRCYKDSFVYSIPVAGMLSVNKFLGTWKNKVDRYIALTNFAKEKYIEGGLPADKIVVKPNFIKKKTFSETDINISDEYILYVGRISIEKGLHYLLEAWGKLKHKNNTKLFIIGDGPNREQLMEKYKHLQDVVFLGSKPSDEVIVYMEKAKYLVVPSIWYEGFPMTIVEAYSVGTPVLASALGSLQEVVRDNETGFLFKHADDKDLANTIEKALSYKNYDSMKENVKNVFEKNYSEEVNFKLLLNIYNEVIKEKYDDEK
jgi:glycosyltransferase involved in cell wall biosynthesis